jgi:thiamine biosynthesis lipoprotein
MEHRFEFDAMGGPCRVLLAGSDAHTAQAGAEAVIAEVRRIEAKYSRYRADSVVAQLNAAAGGEWTELDAETAALLDYADTLHALSDGRFDPTSGVLRRCWDFRRAVVPAAEVVQALLPLIGWQRVQREGQRLRLPQAGMELDFGGFGKEYACDRAATLLQSRGFTSGIVNLGGDLRVLGPQPDGQPWQVGIAHPRAPGQTIASLALSEGALATSGDYERWFEHAGRRYCHLMDARCGWPVRHWQAISVTAPACIAAGGLTTLAMLMEADALPFLDSQGLPYLAIDASGHLHRCDAH